LLAASGAPPTSLDGWVCEPKLDGWRAIVEVRGGCVQVTSRNGHDLTDRVPSVHALAGAGDLVLDGELIHHDGSMRSFYGLLGALHRGEAAFVAFDVLSVGEEVMVDRSYRVRR
jgi:bifunctional non-homologous end joining protein LigD